MEAKKDYIETDYIETETELDFLELTLQRIKKKEIKTDFFSRIIHHKYKGIIAKYKEREACLNFIDNFFSKVMLTKKPHPLSIYERLYLKMINLTKIRTTEFLKLKCSDFIVKGDYCLVADKYLLFIPLFVEAKGIAKDDELFFKRLEKELFRKAKKPRKYIRTLDYLNRELFKSMGLFGIQQNEMRLIFFIYLIHLGLYDLQWLQHLLNTTLLYIGDLSLSEFASKGRAFILKTIQEKNKENDGLF
ncbi:hypothetical protein [Helicobacter pylori]|uniref:hypothetical protein n=1 Tax=Helicobacter pylori TaxID=210 RepID=UPI000410A938|nr:hypothetical protein [Helicobacter pylori]